MDEKKVETTVMLNEAQRAIVDADRGLILVSASAGTGKTYTMTHRLIKRVREGQLSLDRCLILTFTEAAAKSMKDRIAKALRTAIQTADGLERQALLRQELLLETAQISTIHAFCLSVIKRHVHQLGEVEPELLSAPQAGVADDEVSERLWNEALDEVLTQAYQEADEAYQGALELGEEVYPFFWQLSDLLASSKSDEALRQEIKTLLSFLRTMPDYADWARDALARYDERVKDFGRSEVAQYYLEAMRELTAYCLPKLKACLASLESPDLLLLKDEIKSERYKAESIPVLKRLIDGLDELTWDALYELSQEELKPYVPQNRQGSPATAYRQALLEAIEELLYVLKGEWDKADCKERHLFHLPKQLFAKSTQEHEEELRKAKPYLTQFVELCLQVDRHYTALKRQEKLLDYSDMEHLAYELLKSPSVQHYYRTCFDEIYVDEYQDTSSLQEALLLQMGEERLFMVGDLKQSIYRFRHANPKLFLRRYEELSQAKAKGQLFRLSENYRSEPGLLHWVNQVFVSLMHPKSSGICYREGHAFELKKETVEASQSQESLQLLLFEDDRERQPESLATSAFYRHLDPTAICLARAVQAQLEAGRQPGDIAVLSRKNKELQEVAKVFQLMGLPYVFEKESQLSLGRTLRAFLAYLCVLDYPDQDQMLASALLSSLSVAGFDAHELMRLKQVAIQQEASLRYEEFYRACRCVLQLPSEALGEYDALLQGKLARFYETVSFWRAEALRLPWKRFLEALLEELDLRQRLLAEEDGEAKAAQLEEVLRWLEGFALIGRSPLRAMSERLEELGGEPELKQRKLEQSGQLPIRLMSFHKSKGLEFKLVYLYTKSSRRPKQEKKSKLAFSEQVGLAINRPKLGEKDDGKTMVQRYIADLDRKEELEEDLRLFYVALTRAEEKVYLCSDFAQLAETVEQSLWLLPHQVDEVPAYKIRDLQTKSLVLLLLQGLLYQRPELVTPFEEWIEARVKELECGTLAQETVFSLACLGAVVGTTTQQVEALFGTVGRQNSEKRANETGRLEDLKRRRLVLELEVKRCEEGEMKSSPAYAYLPSTTYGLKYSVSALKKRSWEDEESQEHPSSRAVADLARQLRDLPPRQGTTAMEAVGTTDSENFSEERPLKAHEVGTMLHRLYRYLRPAHFVDLGEHKARDLLKRQLGEWLACARLTEAEYSVALKHQKDLLAYLQSDLARLVARCDLGEKGSSVYREIPFTLVRDLGETLGETGEGKQDKVMVQGVIDLWFELEGKRYLVDFKTDRLFGTEEEIEKELGRRYQTQFDYYALAIKAETGKAVDEALVWLSRAKRPYQIALKKTKI